MSTLRHRWDALAPREQRIVALGALALLLILGYLWVWEPISQARADARIRVAGAEADLAWMRAAAPLVQQRGNVAPLQPADGRSLLARVDASARESGLGGALLRVEPVAAGQVRAYFEQAGFDALMHWVEALSQRHGTRVTEMSVQRADGVGLVDVRMSLEEAAP